MNRVSPFPVCPTAAAETHLLCHHLEHSIVQPIQSFVKQTQFPTKKKRASYLEVCFLPIISGLEVVLQV